MAMDIIYGWPYDGSLTDNAKPKLGEGIVAGMVISKDSNGELIKCLGGANAELLFALEDQANPTVATYNVMAYVSNNIICLTDQFTAGAYAPGLKLKVNAADPGKFTLWVSGTDAENLIVGTCDGYVTRDGVQYIKVLFKH